MNQEDQATTTPTDLRYRLMALQRIIQEQDECIEDLQNRVKGVDSDNEQMILHIKSQENLLEEAINEHEKDADLASYYVKECELLKEYIRRQIKSDLKGETLVQLKQFDNSRQPPLGMSQQLWDNLNQEEPSSNWYVQNHE